MVLHHLVFCLDLNYMETHNIHAFPCFQGLGSQLQKSFDFILFLSLIKFKLIFSLFKIDIFFVEIVEMFCFVQF